MDGTVDFFAPTRMPQFLLVNSWHFARYGGQIDYLQTIWGDLENH